MNSLLSFLIDVGTNDIITAIIAKNIVALTGIGSVVTIAAKTIAKHTKTKIDDEIISAIEKEVD